VSLARQLEREGVDVAVIAAGRFKAEGHPALPMTDAERQHLQRVVDDAYQQFVEAVARGRGVPVGTVKSQFGEGRTVTAAVALQAGMVDVVRPTPAAVAALADETRARAALHDSRRALTATGLRPHRAELARTELAARRRALAAATGHRELT
jgi:ClpP class serine protease